ncbi:MAG: 2Fe-2S iron-sulfur cluster-binding protein [Burkholderiaceae bacterium]
MKQCSRDRQHTIRLTLNGAARSAACEPRMLLSDFLREGLGATGTHVGCEHGVCGACTVQINGVAGRSCLTLSGHFCRCTGYTPIVAAVLETASLRRQAATIPHPGD